MNDSQQRLDASAGRCPKEHLAPGLIQILKDIAGRDTDPGDNTEAEQLMRDAINARATDIHLDPYGERYRVRFRIDGAMIDVADIEAYEGTYLLNQIRVLASLDPVPTFKPEGGRFTYHLDKSKPDVRVTEVPCFAGNKLSIRILASTGILQDANQLGFDENKLQYLQDWLETIGGMMLVAGPTGSGKTTTLYSLLHQLKLVDNHVVTLENPVEYEIPGINQIPVREDRGLTFITGAQAMLRLDPDYLVIGELTEAESAQAALNAAASGRASMGTVHSRDAADTVTVLRNFGLDNFKVASNLELVIAQRLVRRLCPNCREQRSPSRIESRWLESQLIEVPSLVWAPSGCSECNGLGYKGRIGIFEIWRPDEEDYTLILDNQDSHTIRRHLAERDHKFLIHDGWEKASCGDIDISDLRRLGALGMTKKSSNEDSRESS